MLTNEEGCVNINKLSPMSDRMYLEKWTVQSSCQAHHNDVNNKETWVFYDRNSDLKKMTKLVSVLKKQRKRASQTN